MITEELRTDIDIIIQKKDVLVCRHFCSSLSLSLTSICLRSILSYLSLPSCFLTYLFIFAFAMGSSSSKVAKGAARKFPARAPGASVPEAVARQPRAEAPKPQSKARENGVKDKGE